MLCMLQIVFSSDTIADNARVARHLQIFFENLMGIAAHPNIRAVAVERLITLTHPAAMWATHAMGLALTAPTATANIVALFHHNVTSSFR
jgi:acid stress-induced BolA-like protein IbaG/YrbA